MQKKRYWGLAALSIIWMLAIVLVNAAAGRTGTSAATAMWALVAFYAIAGNIGAVASIAKWVSILQVVVGTVFFFVLTNNADMQLYFGAPGEFALGIGIPTIVWISLYFWANGKAASQAQDAPVQGQMIINAPKMETSSNIEVSSRQRSEAPPIDDRPKYFVPTADQTAAAEILLQHDDQVKATIRDLVGLPKDVVDQVLIEIVNQPSINPQAVRNQALLAALGRPDMNWSEEFDLIVRKCRDANIEDVKEFFRVFPVLSRRMTPIEVFRKLITEKVSQLYVVSAAGKEVPVTQHGTSSYTLQSHLGQKVFASLDEVYEYLGTPINKRR